MNWSLGHNFLSERSKTLGIQINATRLFFVIFIKPPNQVKLVQIHDIHSLRPYSHTIFLHTILRYCDKKIKRHFLVKILQLHFKIFSNQFAISIIVIIKIFSIHTVKKQCLKIYFYRNIFLSFYRNIVSKNVSCEQSLRHEHTYIHNSTTFFPSQN